MASWARPLCSTPQQALGRPPDWPALLVGVNEADGEDYMLVQVQEVLSLPTATAQSMHWTPGNLAGKALVSLASLRSDASNLLPMDQHNNSQITASWLECAAVLMRKAMRLLQGVHFKGAAKLFQLIDTADRLRSKFSSNWQL